jgi:hypothetical protein
MPKYSKSARKLGTVAIANALQPKNQASDRSSEADSKNPGWSDRPYREYKERS